MLDGDSCCRGKRKKQKRTFLSKIAIAPGFEALSIIDRREKQLKTKAIVDEDAVLRRGQLEFIPSV